MEKTGEHGYALAGRIDHESARLAELDAAWFVRAKHVEAKNELVRVADEAARLLRDARRELDFKRADFLRAAEWRAAVEKAEKEAREARAVRTGLERRLTKIESVVAAAERAAEESAAGRKRAEALLKDAQEKLAEAEHRAAAWEKSHVEQSSMTVKHARLASDTQATADHWRTQHEGLYLKSEQAIRERDERIAALEAQIREGQDGVDRLTRELVLTRGSRDDFAASLLDASWQKELLKAECLKAGGLNVEYKAKIDAVCLHAKQIEAILDHHCCEHLEEAEGGKDLAEVLHQPGPAGVGENDPSVPACD